MSFQLQYMARIVWIPDGAGPLSVGSAQQITLGQLALGSMGTLTIGTATGQPTGYQQVPGGDAPTQSNFNTACDAMTTDIETAIAANLTQIQAFATGGG